MRSWSLSGLTLDLDGGKEQRTWLVRYMQETFNTWNFYAFKYFLCDTLNLVNVLSQLLLLNSFLGNNFLIHGLELLHPPDFEVENRTDPMIRLFPRSVSTLIIIYTTYC